MKGKIYIQSYSLRSLKRQLDKQVFAIPELQRVFVWDKPKICKLMDSIFRNYPIGTALIWEVDKNKGITIRHSAIALPPFDPQRNKTVKFIVDGQQRLSTIYNILSGEIVISKNKEIDFRKVYFSLSVEHEKDFYYLKRTDDKNLIPLTEILQNPVKWFQGKFTKPQIKRLLHCRNQFLNYKFHFLTTTTTDLDEVRETFIRINSLGTPVSAADKAFARAANIDLRKLVSTTKSRFNSGFETLPDNAILTAIALIEGSNEVGEKAVNYFIDRIIKEEIGKLEYQKKWRRIEQSIGKAIDYLKSSMKVEHYRYLPSYNMVSLLSCFYYFNNNAQPDSRQRKEIRKWFWHTGLAARYSGLGYRRNILEDVKFFKRLARNSSAKYAITEKIPPADIRGADYSKHTSIGSAYYLILKQHNPKYLENGENIRLDDYSTIANRSDKHHIFPKAFLKRRGISKKSINSILNICYLPAQENQSIGGSSGPSVYLDEYRRKKFFPSVMKSHLIPHNLSSGLWDASKKGYQVFLTQRQKLVIKAFEKAAGAKLFEQGRI